MQLVIEIFHQKIEEVWFAAALENKRIYATAFSLTEREVLQSILRSLPYNVPFQLAKKSNIYSQRLLKALKDIYYGKDVALNLQLEMNHLSSYAQKVLKCVSLVKVGYVTTYGAVAKTVGGSPRAVGRVMALNPFVLLIPCHRVVCSDMTLGGYGVGQELKWEILQRENRRFEKRVRMRVNEKFLSLFPAGHVKRGRV